MHAIYSLFSLAWILVSIVGCALSENVIFSSTPMRLPSPVDGSSDARCPCLPATGWTGTHGAFPQDLVIFGRLLCSEKSLVRCSVSSTTAKPDRTLQTFSVEYKHINITEESSDSTNFEGLITEEPINTISFDKLTSHSNKSTTIGDIVSTDNSLQPEENVSEVYSEKNLRLNSHIQSKNVGEQRHEQEAKTVFDELNVHNKNAEDLLLAISKQEGESISQSPLVIDPNSTPVTVGQLETRTSETEFGSRLKFRRRKFIPKTPQTMVENAEGAESVQQKVTDQTQNNKITTEIQGTVADPVRRRLSALYMRRLPMFPSLIKTTEAKQTVTQSGKIEHTEQKFSNNGNINKTSDNAVNIKDKPNSESNSEPLVNVVPKLIPQESNIPKRTGLFDVTNRTQYLKQNHSRQEEDPIILRDSSIPKKRQVNFEYKDVDLDHRFMVEQVMNVLNSHKIKSGHGDDVKETTPQISQLKDKLHSQLSLMLNQLKMKLVDKSNPMIQKYHNLIAAHTGSTTVRINHLGERTKIEDAFIESSNLPEDVISGHLKFESQKYYLPPTTGKTMKYIIPDQNTATVYSSQCAAKPYNQPTENINTQPSTTIVVPAESEFTPVLHSGAPLSIIGPIPKGFRQIPSESFVMDLPKFEKPMEF